MMITLRRHTYRTNHIAQPTFVLAAQTSCPLTAHSLGSVSREDFPSLRITEEQPNPPETRVLCSRFLQLVFPTAERAATHHQVVSGSV